tara:strand:- start:963 stop:1526 length:564 start_codon:yes stop_codon:yes gene_type:complete
MNERRQKLIKTYNSNKIEGVELLLDNVHDPHNVAAVSRSADALGIRIIHLYYTYNECPDMKSKGHKASASANQWIQYQKVDNLNEFIGLKKSQKFKVYGAAKQEGARDASALIFPKRTLLLMGSEQYGLSRELRDVVDEFVFIPMVGMVESYNISVAASILMYQIFQQRKSELDLSAIDSLRGTRAS